MIKKFNLFEVNKGFFSRKKKEVEEPKLKTPLFDAIYNNDDDLAIDLIDDGYDVDEINKYGGLEGFTPLVLASLQGKSDIVLKLIRAGANMNYKNKFNWSPLVAASSNARLECVKILLDNGSNDYLDSIKAAYDSIDAPNTELKIYSRICL